MYGDTESVYGLLERLSSFFVVLLICRFAHVMFNIDSKCRVKHETNKMEACEISPQVLVTSSTFADTFTSRLSR